MSELSVAILTPKELMKQKKQQETLKREEELALAAQSNRVKMQQEIELRRL